MEYRINSAFHFILFGFATSRSDLWRRQKVTPQKIFLFLNGKIKKLKDYKFKKLSTFNFKL